MSERCLDIIESTTQKTHEWIARVRAVIASDGVMVGEMQKAMRSFPQDMQALFPRLASPS